MVALWLSQTEWVALLILVVVFTSTGMLLHWLPSRPGASTFVETYQGVVAPLFSVSGAAFALTISFLGNSVWDTARTATQIVTQEREGLLTVIALSSNRPGVAAQLPDLARTYIRAVLQEEWNPPVAVISSPRTEAALHDLMRAVADPAIGRSLGAGLQTTLIDAVQRIASARTVRLGIVDLHTHHFRWTCALLLALLMQASIAVVHLNKARPRALALFLATASIIVIVGLVVISEGPFSGAVTVSPLLLRQILG